MAPSATAPVPAAQAAPVAAAPSAAVFGLPNSVVGPVDLGRLIRETESLNNELMQQELRGSDQVQLPKTSRLLDQTVELNKLDMLKEADRKQLIASLARLHDKAPTLHISFSADPSPLFIEKIMGWLRKEISPQVLLTVGEQPSIGAGCVVRTANKYFDFSLRQDFMKKRELLMQALVDGRVAAQEASAAPAQAAPTAEPTRVAAPAAAVHQRVQA